MEGFSFHCLFCRGSDFCCEGWSPRSKLRSIQRRRIIPPTESVADEWEGASGVSGETGIHRNGGSLSSSYPQSLISHELVRNTCERGGLALPIIRTKPREEKQVELQFKQKRWQGEGGRCCSAHGPKGTCLPRVDVGTHYQSSAIPEGF